MSPDIARPASIAADRPWPPQRADVQVAASGAIEIVGRLMNDAELRIGAVGGRGVLRFRLETGSGLPYEVARPIPAGANDLQAATTLQRALRRGVSVRVNAHGCIPRTDHDHAVLQLLEVTNVTAI